MKTKILLGGLVALSSVLTLTGNALAAPPTDTGADGVPQVVVGGGSDTTYLVAQRLETLYNGAPGCAIDTTESTGKGACLAAADPLVNANGNWDHDLFVGATPTGSGAGVDALRVGMSGAPGTGITQYTPNIDYARSSSGASGTRADQVTYWGYARDAIVVLSFGDTHANLCISQQELKDVYSNVITNWSGLSDCEGNAYPSAPIIPWAMNSASGTNSSFNAYIAPVSTATNGRKLKSTNQAPFENDVKPLLADKGTDNILGNADDDENNYLWWMSFGAWQTYPFASNGCTDGGLYNPSANTCSSGSVIFTNAATVGDDVDAGYPNGEVINNNTYPILRTLFHVTRNTEADCTTTNATGTGTRVGGGAGAVGCNNVGEKVYGPTTGKGGAVRAFTQWLCRTSDATHTVNPVTGRGYRTEILAALASEGFYPTSTNTAGYACLVTT